MGNIFAIDTTALIIACAFIVFWLISSWKKKNNQEEPTLYFSMLDSLKEGSKTLRARYASLPNYLALAALLFFLIAFIDPHFLSKKPTKPTYDKNPPTEGIAIYLLADRSGSMRELVNVVGPEGLKENISKMNLLKQVTTEFIEGNPALELRGHSDDLIGLIAFARAAQILSPLTLDHQVILDDLKKLDVVHNPTEDGTSMGYAIYKTVNLIAVTKHFAEAHIKEGKPAYSIKNAIIVIVTDGLQYPSPLDKGNRLRNIGLDEAATYAKENNVKVYLVNVDPGISDPELAPQRHQMQRITEMTGGKFYMVNETGSLNKIFAEIDRIEKGPIPVQSIESPEEANRKENLMQRYNRISLYPYLIALGMLCLALSILLRTTVLKQVP